MMFRPRDTIDQYRLAEKIGSGSYGMVFAAENTVSHQRCALKLVPLGGRAGERELAALRRYHDLEHPNLLKLHHAGITGEYLYYTMDLADGKLADRHLDAAGLRRAAVKLADALASLHDHKLLHRDVKPDNLFSLNGEPLIGDVGLVTADSGASLTGTPGFLPPEVRSGGAELSERSDLYALAKSFYCLLSGNPPGDYPKYSGPVNPNAAVLLQAVLAVCDDTGSIGSAAEFRDFLLKSKAPRRRHPFAGIVIVFALALLLTGGALLHFRRRPAEPPAPAVQPSRAEIMLAELREAERCSETEQAAIERQRKRYDGLKRRAAAEAAELYPRGRRTSVKLETRRIHEIKSRLERLLREQAEQEPEFRCFYVLRNELEQLTPPIGVLEKHPEKAASLEKEFALWRQKRAEYCRERDRLLGR